MNQLIVVNSFGPMASTLVSGLLETMGYLNVPVRKLGLHRYLLGELSLDSGYMQSRIENILTEHAKASLSGGVSVMDRADQEAKSRVDLDIVRDSLEAYKAKKFGSIQELYNATKDLYAKAVTYKFVRYQLGRHIELTVDVPRYDFSVLQQRYQEEFDSVKFIHLHRPFRTWIASTASQSFVHPHAKSRYYFFPHKRYEDFQKYEQATRSAEGMQFEFSDLFDLGIEQLYDRISNYIGGPARPDNLREIDYDMYGKFVPFKKAFTPFDAKMVYLSEKSLDYFDRQIIKNNFKSPFGCSIAWLKYVYDMHQFRQKMKSIDKIQG